MIKKIVGLTLILGSMEISIEAASLSRYGGLTVHTPNGPSINRPLMPAQVAVKSSAPKPETDQKMTAEQQKLLEKYPLIKAVVEDHGICPWLDVPTVFHAKKQMVRNCKGVDWVKRLEAMIAINDQWMRLDGYQETVLGFALDGKDVDMDLIKYLLQKPMSQWDINPGNWQKIKEKVLKSNNRELKELFYNRIRQEDARKALYAVHAGGEYMVFDPKESPDKIFTVFSEKDLQELAQSLSDSALTTPEIASSTESDQKITAEQQKLLEKYPIVQAVVEELSINPWLNPSVVIHDHKLKLKSARESGWLKKSGHLNDIQTLWLRLRQAHSETMLEFALDTKDISLVKYLLQKPIAQMNINPRNWRRIKESVIATNNQELTELICARIQQKDARTARYGKLEHGGFHYFNNEDERTPTEMAPVFSDKDVQELSQALLTKKDDGSADADQRSQERSCLTGAMAGQAKKIENPSPAASDKGDAKQNAS